MGDPRETQSLPFVITYIFSEKPKEFIEFTKSVFGAVEARETSFSEDGNVQNAMLQIGSSYFEISQARENFQQVKLSFHLYCDNVAEYHKMALKAGCSEKSQPQKMDYGDTESWVIDPFGNNWFLATYG